jgi:uncharacterized protein
MLTLSVDEFFAAIKAGNLVKIKELVEKDPALLKADYKTGATGILFALYAGKKDIARFLAERKADLNIFEAASLGDNQRINSLLKNEPGLTKSFSPEGFTALQLAAYMGQKETVESLVRAGAEVNAIARNPSGYTALSGAVAMGHREVAESLLAKKANASHRYEGGFSPLMEAAANGNLEIVRLLLNHGADPAAQMSDGKTALSFALEKGHSEVATLLRTTMAKTAQ